MIVLYVLCAICALGMGIFIYGIKNAEIVPSEEPFLRGDTPIDLNDKYEWTMCSKCSLNLNGNVCSLKAEKLFEECNAKNRFTPNIED